MGHRLRWTAVWVLVAVWFVAQAANVGGNAVHLVLLIAIALPPPRAATSERGGFRP
jgi:hypothetical protein